MSYVGINIDHGYGIVTRYGHNSKHMVNVGDRVKREHRPWMWDFSNLLIANAGSVSSERVRGFFENSYNIIKIENRNISIDLKIVGGERKPLQTVVKNYTNFEEE